MDTWASRSVVSEAKRSHATPTCPRAPRAWIGACGSTTAPSWGDWAAVFDEEDARRRPEHDRGKTRRVVGALLARCSGLVGALLARCWRLVGRCWGPDFVVDRDVGGAAGRLLRRKSEADSRSYGAARATLTKRLMFHVKHWPVKPSAVEISKPAAMVACSARKSKGYPSPPLWSLPSRRASSRCSGLVSLAATPPSKARTRSRAARNVGSADGEKVERLIAPVARQHLAPDQSALLELEDHRAHGRFVDAEGGSQRHLRDAGIGPDQGEHPERARREVETLERGFELEEDLGLRAPHLIADIGRQLVEIDLPPRPFIERLSLERAGSLHPC